MKKKFITLSLILPFLLLSCAGRGEPIIDSSSSIEEPSIYYSEDSKEEVSSSEYESLFIESSKQYSDEYSSEYYSSEYSSLEVSSKEEVVVPNYVLHCLFGGYEDWVDLELTRNPSSSSEYMIKGVTLYKYDVFKVHMSGNTWYGYSLKNSIKSGLVTIGEKDDNIEVKTSGIYDIYCDYNESDGGHIYLAKVDDGEQGNVSVTGISLNRTGKFLVTRNEFKLEATIYPENATNKGVTWRSSDTNIATVTSSGRVTANSTRGSTTITAKTEDGGYTATCLIYVSPSNIPAYYLTGTINGRSYGYGTYIYAALPLSTNKYIIPDVNLIAGDELTVTGYNGAKLKNKYNQTYTYSISKKMSVDVYLDIGDANKNYLTLVEK